MQVPNIPSYYDKYTSISLREDDPDKVFERMKASVKNLPDFKVTSMESFCRIDLDGTVLYDNGYTLRIHLNLFRKIDGKLLLEVQRRSGNSFDFHTIYKIIEANLDDISEPKNDHAYSQINR